MVAWKTIPTCPDSSFHRYDPRPATRKDGPFPLMARCLRSQECVQSNYRFRIQPLFGGIEPRFQLTVGMEEEKDFEMIPVHRTAFAQRFRLQQAHPSQADVQLELTSLLEWLHSRQAR